MLNTDNPYNQCLRCDYQEKGAERCDGPRTSSMPIENWREFMRNLKDVKHLTYDEISELTDNQLPARTIQSALSLSSKGDITRETARLIENAIFGSSSQYPCYLAFEQSLPLEAKKVQEVETEMEKMQERIRMIHDFYKEELESVREDANGKVDFYKSQLEELKEQVGHMRIEMDHLRSENDRKSELIDKYLFDKFSSLK